MKDAIAATLDTLALDLRDDTMLGGQHCKPGAGTGR
jgi:hypothetical protein